MEYMIQLTRKDYTESRMEQIFSKTDINNDALITIKFIDVTTKEEAEKLFTSIIYHLSDKLRINKKYMIKLENLPKSFNQAYKSTTFQRKIKGRKGGAFYAYLGENGFVTLRMKAPGTKALSYFSNMKNKAMFFPLDSDRVNIFRLDVTNGCNLQNIIKSIVMSAITQYNGKGEFKVDLWLKTKRVDGDWNYTQSNVYGVVYTCRKLTPNVVKINIAFDKKSINKIMTKSKSTIDELTGILTANNIPTIEPTGVIDGEKILLFFSPHTDSITNYGMTILKHMNSWGITRQVITDMLSVGQVVGKISDLTSVLESNFSEVNNVKDESLDETSDVVEVKENETYISDDTTVKEDNISATENIDTTPDENNQVSIDETPVHSTTSTTVKNDSRALSHDAIDLIYDIDEMIRVISDRDDDVLSLAIKMVESLNLSSNKSSLIKFIMTYAKNKKKKEA